MVSVFVFVALIGRQARSLFVALVGGWTTDLKPKVRVQPENLESTKNERSQNQPKFTRFGQFACFIDQVGSKSACRLTF